MTFPYLAVRTLRGLALAVLSAGLLNACGGSTSQVNRFMPQRILAFGDELNFLTQDGHKYSVNALKTDKTLDCETSPTWVQYMALHLYGKVFSQCVGSGVDIAAFNLAAVDSRVDDFATQIYSYTSNSGFQSSDLVTVLVGMHDVLDLYRLYDGSNQAALVAEAQNKGDQLGAATLQIVGTGARVVISTIPDMGLTPYAWQQKADVGDDRPGVLSALSDAFNKGMRLKFTTLDGSQLGLLMADDLVRGATTNPGAYALTNVTQAACTTALPNCTTDTVVDAAANASNAYLWADELHPGATFHTQLGVQAVSRISNLPF
jgi:phospholipase/lecithinase/hemolysin